MSGSVDDVVNNSTSWLDETLGFDGIPSYLATLLKTVAQKVQAGKIGKMGGTWALSKSPGIATTIE